MLRASARITVHSGIRPRVTSNLEQRGALKAGRRAKERAEVRGTRAKAVERKIALGLNKPADKARGSPCNKITGLIRLLRISEVKM